MWYLVDSKNRTLVTNTEKKVIKSDKRNRIIEAAKVHGKFCGLKDCDKGGCFQPAYIKQ